MSDLISHSPTFLISSRILCFTLQADKYIIKLNELQRMCNFAFLTSIILYMRAHFSLGDVLTWSFEIVPDYRPALILRQTFVRSRLHCGVSCIENDACVGVIFHGRYNACVAYTMVAGMNTVQLVPDVGISSYIKGKHTHTPSLTIHQSYDCRGAKEAILNNMA